MVRAIRLLSEAMGIYAYHWNGQICSQYECEKLHWWNRDDALAYQKEVNRVEYDPPPEHYRAEGLQLWEIWDAFDLDRYTANVVKYVVRAGHKKGQSRLDDLVKARNYILKAIEMEENR